jgi:hypothetical protein
VRWCVAPAAPRPRGLAPAPSSTGVFGVPYVRTWMIGVVWARRRRGGAEARSRTTLSRKQCRSASVCVPPLSRALPRCCGRHRVRSHACLCVSASCEVCARVRVARLGSVARALDRFPSTPPPPLAPAPRGPRVYPPARVFLCPRAVLLLIFYPSNALELLRRGVACVTHSPHLRVRAC